MRFFKKPGCAAQRCDVDGSRLERRVSGAWRLQCRRFRLPCLPCHGSGSGSGSGSASNPGFSIHALGRVACGSAPRTSDRGPSTLNFERSANHRRRTHCRSLWSLLHRARKTRPDDFRSASTREASRPKPSMRRRPSRRGAPAPLFIAPRVPRTFVQHPHHTFTRATALRTGDTRSRHAETVSAAAPELIDAAVAGIASAALPGRPYTRRRRSTRGEAGRIRLARPTTPRHTTRACLLRAREPACPPAPAYADRAATNAAGYAGYAGPRVATSLRGDARDMRASTPRSCACTAHAARPNVPFHGVRACGGVDERDIDRRAAIRRHRIPDARPTFDRGFPPPSRHGAPGHARIQTTSNSHRMHVQLTLNRHLIHIQNTL
ncbi:Uncharacterised protein [Burkholderia pseudomallei]|nr:Uncharacterised protein [Burkholderia pseudomallei]CAJ3371123.1 Uncharacterised protein [Burkholderia pseudomallei]CAJ3446938.1 Uncharacterised protein [Burkholderia pseudomallei]CAJ5942073.1 Uncharacterised protein [Burkholderia pseudomallei]CAJ7394415.1 Uncharacterised protein [Burkholderia pseudomallei]